MFAGSANMRLVKSERVKHLDESHISTNFAAFAVSIRQIQR
jgi:hypothetical protein